MRSRKRPLTLLIAGILSLCALAGFIYFLSPETPISFSGMITGLPFSLDKYIRIPPVSIFFLLLALFLFSIGSYIFKSIKHGILIAGFVIIYLTFRLNHLTNPFFLVLLLALFFVLELLVSSRGNSKQ
ncbi:MAG TPA: hypothetical protein VND99_02610 [Candidatus Acidoferrales bacterium]|nr:hypothetical protein [Candidatus Acidoferrales bacterium]